MDFLIHLAMPAPKRLVYCLRDGVFLLCCAIGKASGFESFTQGSNIVTGFVFEAMPGFASRLWGQQQPGSGSDQGPGKETGD